jgi:hypothetical protein
MDELDEINCEVVLERIRAQAAVENIRITQHAQQEMVEEDVTLAEVLQAIATAQILENYPEHRRGACCLLNGLTHKGRALHIVCTAAQPVLIIITVYEPKPPRWVTPTQRRQ